MVVTLKKFPTVPYSISWNKKNTTKKLWPWTLLSKSFAVNGLILRSHSKEVFGTRRGNDFQILWLGVTGLSRRRRGQLDGVVSRLRHAGGWEMFELAIESLRFVPFTLELAQSPMCHCRTHTTSFVLIQGIRSQPGAIDDQNLHFLTQTRGYLLSQTL